MDFTGVRVVVIGGTSGIGMAVAQGVSERGGRVVVASSNAEKVERARASLSSADEAMTLDVKDEEQVAAFFEAVGPFDHLGEAIGGRVGPDLRLD